MKEAPSLSVLEPVTVVLTNNSAVAGETLAVDIGLIIF
jgi:hypothetical protein